MKTTHKLIEELVSRGAWPTGELNAIPKSAICAIAPDEDRLVLYPPESFHTIESEIQNGNKAFWQEFGALSEISPDRFIIIGDFGLGSDTAIVVDAEPSDPDPIVLRLAWQGAGTTIDNHWVTFFERLSDFTSFIESNHNKNEPNK
jgi:hypothetical protein